MQKNMEEQHQRLVVERYERVLKLWANLPDSPSDSTGPNAKDAALKKAVTPIKTLSPELFRDPSGADLAGGAQTWILGVRFHLREAWDAPEAERQWIINALREVYGRIWRMNAVTVAVRTRRAANLDRLENRYSDVPEDSKAIYLNRELQWRAKVESNIDKIRDEAARWGLVIKPMPPDTAFDRMLRYFLIPDTRPLRCPNPHCSHPYFFKDRDKRTQVYCSDKCSRAARRETKNGWWHRSGRAARQAKKSRSTRASLSGVRRKKTGTP